MTALEQEIITQIGKLDASRQRQVLDYARQLENEPDAKPKMAWAEWLALGEQSRMQLLAVYGDDFVVGSQALLDELREEESQ